MIARPVNNGRRRLLLGAGGVALGASSRALAQAFPSRPIRIVVPWAPGGMVDTGGRVIGEALQKAFHQAATVENVPGAAGTVGAAQVAKARGDGHTLLFATSSLAIDVAVGRSMQFDPVRDLAAVSLVANTQSVVIVPPASAIRSIADLMAAAKSAPGQLTYGTPGIGSPAHLFTEMFAQMAGIQMLHVPYGRSPAINDLMGGRISVMFATVPVAIPQIRNGNVRALAVTGARRTSELADVPTLAESGVAGYEAGQWLGVFSPAGTPDEIVGRLNGEIVKALETSAVQEALRARGLDPVSSTREEFARIFAADVRKLRETVRAANIRLE